MYPNLLFPLQHPKNGFLCLRWLQAAPVNAPQSVPVTGWSAAALPPFPADSFHPPGSVPDGCAQMLLSVRVLPAGLPSHKALLRYMLLFHPHLRFSYSAHYYPHGIRKHLPLIHSRTCGLPHRNHHMKQDFLPECAVSFSVFLPEPAPLFLQMLLILSPVFQVFPAVPAHRPVRPLFPCSLLYFSHRW